MLNEQLWTLGYTIDLNYDAGPTRAARQILDALTKRLAAQLALWNEVVTNSLPELGAAAKQADLPLVHLPAPPQIE
jgi:hypothetical protein